jgi:hypothetical protein
MKTRKSAPVYVVTVVYPSDAGVPCGLFSTFKTAKDAQNAARSIRKSSPDSVVSVFRCINEEVAACLS